MVAAATRLNAAGFLAMKWSHLWWDFVEEGSQNVQHNAAQIDRWNNCKLLLVTVVCFYNLDWYWHAL
jgi:hypothetical protein